MKKAIIVIAIFVGYHILGQVTDYNEVVRYSKCTLETNDYDECGNPEKRSVVYNFLLKIEIPQLYDCVLPSGDDNFLCQLFNIERSN